MSAGPVPTAAPAAGATGHVQPDLRGGGSVLAGTGQMLRLALRRDRIMLPAWVLGIAGMATLSAQATVGLYPELPQRVQAAEAINGSAALIALYGRIYDPTSLGELSLFKMTAFGAAMIGVFMIILTVRHTRAEEEAGRLELVGSTVVGRAAPLAAALVVGALAATGIAVLTAGGLVLAGLPVAGSLAFGVAWGVTGMLFAAVGATGAQVSLTARAATGFGLVVLAAAYVARAVGDISEGLPSGLSWLSPIGWSQQVRAFSGTRWVILVLPVAVTAILVPVAFWLRSCRDLGAGLLPDRRGPARGSIDSTWGLAARLQRPGFLAWTAAATLMGLVLGSAADSISGLLDSPAMVDFLEALGGRQGLVDAFLAAELGVIGALAAGYGVAASRWLHTEEESGRAENVLATAAGRRQWAGGHAVLAMLGAAVLMVLTGTAIGIGYALSIGDLSQVGRLALASAGAVPAAWVMVGLAVAIWGYWPRLSWLAWALFVWFLVMGEFGVLWDVPGWLRNLSPFAHSPVLPGPDPQLAGIHMMLVLAVGLVALGIRRFTHRDVVST
jgi:ABC-2 type transport system permease protein